MDHESVVKTQAVERYFLKELSEVDRDAFEDHYFACETCAADVRATSRFVENARAVCREEKRASAAGSRAEPSRSRTRGWLAWLRPQLAIPALAALGLAGVVVYQNAITIPGLQGPRSIAPAIIFNGVTRAAIQRIQEGDALRFQFSSDAAPGKDRVLAELVDASGRRLRAGDVRAPAANAPFDVYFPGMLRPGRYWLVLRPTDGVGTDLARFPFEVVPREMKTE